MSCWATRWAVTSMRQPSTRLRADAAPRRRAHRLPKSFTIYDSTTSSASSKQIYKDLMIDDKFLARQVGHRADFFL